VIPYFHRFLARFPTVEALASAVEDAVLSAWSGLGYYARARNLHRAAGLVMERHSGVFPDRIEDILALPGIGRSTAGAIAVFAFEQRYPILDGNVKRVFARHFGVEGYPGATAVSAQLWALAESHLPVDHLVPYTQGLMDLGASVCTRVSPLCGRCPIGDSCVARRDDRVGELPTPRPKKIRPQRSTIMLVMLDVQKVLLQKRPAAGIWGGLWSFPEVDSADDVVNLCHREFGISVDEVSALPLVAHGFTHFSLSIQPLLCRGVVSANRVNDPGRAWVDLHEAELHAIPVPVRTLLRTLVEQIDKENQAGSSKPESVANR
jgi:A/G-specific adenine glycosylase